MKVKETGKVSDLENVTEKKVQVKKWIIEKTFSAWKILAFIHLLPKFFEYISVHLSIKTLDHLLVWIGTYNLTKALCRYWNSIHASRGCPFKRRGSYRQPCEYKRPQFLYAFFQWYQDRFERWHSKLWNTSQSAW